MKASQSQAKSEDPIPHAAPDVTATDMSNGSGGKICGDGMSTLATVGLIGVGAALIEASLIPGIIIGVAAMAAPKYTRQIGEAIRPMVNSAVKGACRFGLKTREAFAEAQEHVQDLVAEAQSEATDATAPAAGTNSPSA